MYTICNIHSYNYFDDHTNINHQAIRKKFANTKPEKTDTI